MKKRIFIIGAGGHAASVMDAALMLGEFDIAGCLDPSGKGEVLGVPVIGGDELIARAAEHGVSGFFVALGDNGLRQALFERCVLAGLKPVSIISPFAVIAKTAKIGAGTCVLHKCVVNARAEIGDNCIINTGAIVEHDCCVGQSCHISVGALLCGTVTVGDGTLIAPGAIVRNGASVGSGAVIGMGSVVTGDIEGGVIAYGNPAKVIKHIT